MGKNNSASKIKQTSTCLDIRISDLHSQGFAAVQLKFLVSKSSEMNFVVSEKLLVSKNAFSWFFFIA